MIKWRREEGRKSDELNRGREDGDRLWEGKGEEGKRETEIT